MSDKNWQQMSEAERARRFANVTRETHGDWLWGVVQKMIKSGSGHGSAIEAVRQQQTGKEQS
jgi:hypothetical protein